MTGRGRAAKVAGMEVDEVELMTTTTAARKEKAEMATSTT